MAGAGERDGEEEEEEIVCLEASFFINDNYELKKFTFGSHSFELYCLQSASSTSVIGKCIASTFRPSCFRRLCHLCIRKADFDLTGQLVWPGAMLLNEYLSKNVDLLKGCSVIELGSGVGITGILCSRFCREVVLTDHNDEVQKILKKNIELHSSKDHSHHAVAEKLEWGNSDQINQILRRRPGGFDLILGADICFQQGSVPLLFDTVKQLLQVRERDCCKFILAYVSRAKIMDSLVVSEAIRHGMQINEIPGTRSVVGNLEGVIFEVTLLEKSPM
ncbi:protein N-terminal and lysine N-methyltransferase EFM7 isoform X2 [Punica granatum]|uniref:Protein N-terminal and lysine N-methyltransferase EFM7 isoform X2 n=1 Tax=Punica granatum TaxID=22663 RepID=A0A6P8DZN1_PUNGR|nr:protein N-terminal and lysine N-methyltransferase EFM7 isoform X2 [Punica granatum]